jgi:hypothetical protein
MDDERKELKELEDPETWDDETTEVHPPAKRGRAVVSVAFPRKDFSRVAQAARAQGLKTSEFIRQAALARLSPATCRPAHIEVTDSSGGFNRDDVTIAAGVFRARFIPDPTLTDQVFVS